MKQLILFLLILTLGKISMAQTAKDDFAKINDTYAGFKQLSIKIKYELFQNKQTKAPYQTLFGEFKKDGSKTYSVIGPVESVDNEDYLVIVDNEDKSISLLGKSKGSEKIKEDSKNELYLVNMQKLLSMCTKISFKQENEQHSSYMLELDDVQYEKIKITFNRKTFLIEKMVFFYNETENLDGKEDGKKEAPRMEVSYYELNQKPLLSAAVFTYNKFLEKSSNDFKCKEPYKGYEINNHLLSNK